MNKTFLIVLSLSLSTLVSAGKIYKYTAPDGSIHYTDVKPDTSSQEVKTDKIIVVESTKTQSRKSWKRLSKVQKNTGFNYDNLAISKPEVDENIWGTGGNVTASVNLEEKLPSQYRLKFFLDGKPHGRVKSNTQLIADVERGEHFIYAQLINAHSRKVLKTTDKVRFYVKQQSKK